MNSESRRIDPIWRDVLLILLVAGLLFGFKLGVRGLYNHDHGFFARVASYMLEDRTWFSMRMGGTPYTNKPHLLFWSICLFSLPKGEVTAFTARLPCVLSAIGSCVVVFFFARELFNRRAALISSYMLMTTWTFAWNARRVRYDIMLTFFTLLAMFLLYKGYREFESGRNWKRYYLWAGVALAFALLVKGVIALALTILPFSVFVVFNKKHSSHAKNLLLTIAPMLVIISIWMFLYIKAAGPEALTNDNIAHLLDKSDQGPRLPFYYYLHKIPADFVPWSALLVVCAAHLWGSMRKERLENYQFLLLWILPVLALLSIAYSKAGRYSYPLHPPLAMIVGGVCAVRMDDENQMKARVRRLADFIVIACALGMSAFVLVVLAGSVLVEQFRYLLGISILFTPVVLLLLLSMRRANPRERFARGIALMMAFMFYFHWGYISYLVENDDKYAPKKAAYRLSVGDVSWPDESKIVGEGSESVGIRGI